MNELWEVYEVLGHDTEDIFEGYGTYTIAWLCGCTVLVDGGDIDLIERCPEHGIEVFIREP
jgi:hypothetical protein